MKANEQTIQQIDRAIKKIAEKFPKSAEPSLLTDIHLRVNQDTGELVAFDDDDKEINRCVVEQWIDNKDDDFFEQIAPFLRKRINVLSDLTEHLSILKPYSFVLEDEEGEPMAELFVADDETVIIDPVMMEGLDKELDDFFEKLMKE